MSRTSTIKKMVINLCLLGVSIVFALLCVEGGFYFLNQFVEDESEIATFESQPNQERLDFFQYHSVYGHAGLPEVRKQFYQHYVTHNSRGLRGKELAYKKRDFVERVVFLGDSQTWGWAVGDQQTIPYYFEAIANSKPQEKIFETVNLGVTGFGIGQSYLRFISEGLRYEPDYVVMTYYADNDVAETSNYEAYGIEKPFMYEKENGQLCVSNVPPLKASGWPSDNVEFVMKRMDLSMPKFTLFGHSFDFGETQTAQYFKKTNFRSSLVGSWGKDDSDPVAAIDQHIGCLEKERGPQRLTHQENIDFAIKLIFRIRDAAEAAGAKFILVAKPFENDYRNDSMSHEYTHILTKLASDGVHILDLYTIGKAAGINADELFSYFAHLTAAGNKVVASNLALRINPQSYEHFVSMAKHKQ